jgi:shikimate kinase/3-dehydroquinate synthase
MSHIILSGPMGAGKTTTGRVLAARLERPFVDTDAVLVERSGQSVADLFRAGESAFRAAEREVVAEALASKAASVIAVGGGALLDVANRYRALDEATVVTLTAAAGVLAGRVGAAGERPLLGGGDVEVRLAEILRARADVYAEAHWVLATDDLTPEAVADAVELAGGRQRLVMPLGVRSYPIDVCAGQPGVTTDQVAASAPSQIVIVTDTNVKRARGSFLTRAVGPLAIAQVEAVLVPGELRKTQHSVSMIWDVALGGGIDRDALVLAFGGGVVGDMAGFAAATLLRGIRWMMVPTTLLAMADASVGGKTGFDHVSGKNLIGAFHQPIGVVADVAHLSTLPERELRAGLAEVVKASWMVDRALAPAAARWLKDGAQIGAAAVDVVRGAVAAKIALVREDERESGPRALLNFGHTVGHALEAHGGFHRWLHGEAVAVGMVAELAALELLGLVARGVSAACASDVEAVGLQSRVRGADLAAASRHLAADKKRRGTDLILPVPSVAGRGRLARVELAAFRRAVERVASNWA